MENCPPFNMMENHILVKKVGIVDKLQDFMDNIHYDLFSLMDTYYIMNITIDYAGLLVPTGKKESTRLWEGKQTGEENNKTLKYHYPIVNHFIHRYIIDDHNNICHDNPSMEETWYTHRLTNILFSFIL